MHRIAALAFAVLLAAMPALSQEAYPSKPITLIVPYAQDPAVAAQLEKIETNLEPADQATPEAHRAKLAAQIELWRPIIEQAGVQAE